MVQVRGKGLLPAFVYEKYGYGSQKHEYSGQSDHGYGIRVEQVLDDDAAGKPYRYLRYGYGEVEDSHVEAHSPRFDGA